MTERGVVSEDQKIARLHNICLPRILADEAFRDRHLKGKQYVKMIETSEAVMVFEDTENRVDHVDSREEDVVEVIEEEEFRTQYLPEEQGADLAIYFISTGELGQSVGSYGANSSETVEEMIRNVFPRLLYSGDHKVGKARNCRHEIYQKPGTVPVKHRVRRVPVHLREELKKSIDSMLARGIIRQSQNGRHP